MDRHAVNQRGPLARVKFGVELRQALDGFDETLQLPAPDHDLLDPIRQLITPALGFFVPADQRFVSLVVLGLVLSHPCVLGNQVVDRLGVDAQLLVQNPALLLQLRGVAQPILDGRELRDVKLPVRAQLVHQPDERGLHLILGQVRRLAAGLVFELGIALPDHSAVLVVAVPDLRAVPAAAPPAANLPGKKGRSAVLWIFS